MRQLAIGARIAERLGGVALRQAFAEGKFIKATQRSEAAGDGRFGIAGFVQSRDVAAEIERCDVGRLGRVTVRLRQVVGQRSEVFAIRFLRQLGGVALDAEEAEELGDGGVHAAPRTKYEGPRTNLAGVLSSSL